MIGFYSAKAIAFVGSAIYSTPDGREVEVTAVYQTREEGEQSYRWDDKEYVGEVDQYMRRGKVGMLTPLRSFA